MLEHTGRKSGETRRTVLEVVVNDPDAVYVAAAWGADAQWLKNVKAGPNVVVHLGAKRFNSRAEVISAEQATGVVSRYGEAHPKLLGRLARFILDDPGDTLEEKARRIAEAAPLVRLPR